MSFIWSESRSAVANIIILGVIVMIGVFTILLIGGLYGIFWRWLTTQLGYANTTVDQALKFFGNPSEMLKWFQTWWDWFWSEVYRFFNWLWNSLQSLSGG